MDDKYLETKSRRKKQKTSGGWCSFCSVKKKELGAA